MSTTTQMNATTGTAWTTGCTDVRADRARELGRLGTDAAMVVGRPAAFGKPSHGFAAGSSATADLRVAGIAETAPGTSASSPPT